MEPAKHCNVLTARAGSAEPLEGLAYFPLALFRLLACVPDLAARVVVARNVGSIADGDTVTVLLGTERPPIHLATRSTPGTWLIPRQQTQASVKLCCK